MWCLYNRFGFPAVTVTKVRQTLPQCVDTRKIHPKGVKRGPGFPGPPECGLRSFISTLRLDPLRKTQPGCTERCLESRNARKRPACVCPCSQPRFDCYFCDISASASNNCLIGSHPAPTGHSHIGSFC